MEVSAKLSYARISAQKARLIANEVRGLDVAKALDFLEFSVKKAAKMTKKLLESAVSNAEFNESAEVDDLFVSKICVDEGPSFKRSNPRAKGRADRICKSTCHITVTVSDSQE